MKRGKNKSEEKENEGSEGEKDKIDSFDDIFSERAMDEDSEVKTEDYYGEDEIIPGRDEAMRRLKRMVKVIDILEFVDSCLIVSERFLSDDEARGVIHSIREKILYAETLFTEYLITGKIPKVQ